MVTKTGTAGVDSLVGTAGADTLSGLGGDDRLAGLAEADLLDGGDGVDTASYDGAAQGVGVDLLGNVGFGGDAKGDTLFFFENVTGSAFADNVRGNNLANALRGGGGDDRLDGFGGDDRLVGGAGADTLIGDVGVDTADYSGSAVGVSVFLLSASGADGDTLIDIENITGSAFDDFLEGDDGTNLLKGGGGDDILVGLGGADQLLGGAGNDEIDGGAGPDILDGGGGVDTLSYQASFGVTVDLSINSASGGDAAGDVIRSFENVSGSNADDTLVGNGGANQLVGFFGADTLEGGGGNDRLEGGFARDQLVGGAGADRFVYGQASDSGPPGSGDFVDRDNIQDFSHAEADRIDLHLIDAKTATDGDQAFAFIGQAAFTAAGQARFFFDGDRTVVEANTAGGGGAEMQIELAGHVTLVGGDFLL